MSNSQNSLIQSGIAAVRAAAAVCRDVQKSLVTADTLEKKDRSPVTVADFASQAIVCSRLIESLGPIDMVGEEHAGELRQDDQAAMRATVIRHVAGALGRDVSEDQVMDWIDQGGKCDPTSGLKRYWTLDPIDGTKGFLRGEQYAIALALIENGQVILGVLGCPNLPLDGKPGTLMVAAHGQASTMLPLWDHAVTTGTPIQVTSMTNAADARFCESVESGHSSHDDAARIAERLGITHEPVRMDSQCKYAAVARGDAQIYLRLPTRKDYREKIWDHAAGMIVMQQAGGTVSDVDGKPLDFSQGRQLENNRGIIASSAGIHPQVVKAVGQVLAGE